MTPEAIDEEVKAAYERLALTPDGKLILNDLRLGFDGELLVLGDPYATHANVGANGVLKYIETMITPDEVET